MSGRALRIGRRTVEISNPDKVLFPDDGITKADLADYYRRAAPAMLPYLRDRPAHVHRYPDGLEGENWVQKEVSDEFPDWIETATVKKKGGSVTQVVCSNAATLAFLADQGSITPHVWLSRKERPQHPDLMIFDLDPTGDRFGPVRDAARLLRDLLGEVDLPAYLKTTGSRGLHVAVPLDRSAEFDQVRELARDLARLAAAQDPRRLTVEMRKEKRRGRLFIDWLRNSYAQTAVAPYGVRARPGAPVATPIEWDELGRVRADTYTMRNLFRRLKAKGDPWRGLWRRARGVQRARRQLDRLLADDRETRS